jgi:GNAT superfamily N-acetyltransferase
VIVRETDEPFIRAVTAHKDVWRYVSGIEDYRPYDLPEGVYYTLLHDGVKAGFMVFRPEDDGVQAHIAVLPEHHGKWIEQAALEAIRDHGGKVKAKAKFHRVYALAYRIGFRKVGTDADGHIDMEFS